MIEIAPKEYWLELTYDEAIFYCFSLEIDGKTGWRLIKLNEKTEDPRIFGWCSDVNYTFPEQKMLISPVRDI